MVIFILFLPRFQLYVNSDRNLTKKIVENVIAKGVKAICVTVDAPQLGRREKDMRFLDINSD